MHNNEEQEVAFRIVGEHVLRGDKEQLLMYMAGTGGSRKMHVVNAIRKLFSDLEQEHKLKLSAPTGCVAVLICGQTIHALTLMGGRSRVNQSELEAIWKDVRYLIIDEISLVSARLLCDISKRLCLAKSADPVAATKPFGGVNIIFLGDFGQLKPVNVYALFSHELVQKLRPNIAEMELGQTALYGAFLWRLVDTVVELKKNWQAIGDPAFVNLLNRVRSGDCWDGKNPRTTSQEGTGINFTETDFDVINHRRLRYLELHSPTELARFQLAPIIVAEKAVRDIINNKKARAFATAVGVEVICYRSRDFGPRKMVLPSEVQRALWCLPSNRTEDALGELPLCPGLPVIVTENLMLAHSVVNGSRGTVMSICYELLHGSRVAKCVFVRIVPSNLRAVDGDPDLVPIFPVATTFKYISEDGTKYSIRREQLPLMPAFAFMDYKVQGQSFDSVVVDLARAWSLQSVYVMLSRAKSLGGLAILRWFPSDKIYQRLSEDVRREFRHLADLACKTMNQFRHKHT